MFHIQQVGGVTANGGDYVVLLLAWVLVSVSAFSIEQVQYPNGGDYIVLIT